MTSDGVYVSNFESNNLIEGTYSKYIDGSIMEAENFLNSDDSILKLTKTSGKSKIGSLVNSQSTGWSK